MGDIRDGILGIYYDADSDFKRACNGQYRAALSHAADKVDIQLKLWAELLHYPACWDEIAYPTIEDAITEALAFAGCSVCKEDKDA